jgi:hypothetical protein
VTTTTTNRTRQSMRRAHRDRAAIEYERTHAEREVLNDYALVALFEPGLDRGVHRGVAGRGSRNWSSARPAVCVITSSSEAGRVYAAVTLRAAESPQTSWCLAAAHPLLAQEMAWLASASFSPDIEAPAWICRIMGSGWSPRSFGRWLFSRASARRLWHGDVS